MDWTGLPAATAAADQALKNNFGVATAYSTKEDNGAVSGLLNLSYQLSDNILTYLTYSRGSKSGGLNLTALPAGISPVVGSETIDSYEGGVKSTLLDHRLVFNAALYWENDKNYQGTLVVPGGVIQYLANIPAVRSRGVETDIEAIPFDWLNLHASTSYDEAIFTHYANGLCGIEWQGLKSSCNLTGHPIPGIPKWDFAFGGELTQPLPGVAADGQGYIDFDYNFRSSTFSAATDSIYSRIGGYGLANFRAGVRWDEHWDVSVYLKNAFDRNYALSQGAGGLGNSGIEQVLPGDPRMVGLTLRAHI
jgi:iron complex outermembrane recepter protein